MNIYLIRHGRQNSKLCNVDVELSPEGREQADLVGKRLQTYHIDVVYSSQLIRAKETADIINKYLNKPRVIEERIQEANFGAMTGMTNEAIDEKYGDYLAQRSTMTTDMTYPDGENCQMVYERAKAGLDDIVKDSLEKGYENICSAGNPSKYMKAWKEAGIRVIPVVASVALARMMERAGADAVVAEGMESGGHIGEETTMTLVPQVVDAVNIPVIAAGGIGDGRGVCAAFMLGAEAVQMGTRFVVAKESNVHQNYKDRVIAAKDIDSVVTGRSTGHPVRSLRNSMTREYLDMEKEGVEFEKLERLTLGTLRKAVVDGDVKQGTVMAGQIAGLVNKEQTCEEIIKELMKEVSEVYNSHNKLA